ncbi:hypothetical protein KAU88_05155 [Candidatus Bathyarchaeota archaeon]|nr:hypothetical protein [Candidatus Bathyarchaeota archaeon]
MTLLTKENQIWRIEPSKKTSINAVRYASMSVNWTFNRLAIKASPWTWYIRMMRIVSGVAVQQCLIRELEKRGKKIIKDLSDYRTEDTFDLALPNGEILDSKASNYYVDYVGPEIRPNFSLKYLIENKDYCGKDYRSFFPCLVPAEQFNVKRKRHKDYYLFAIVTCINFIRDKLTGREDDWLIAAVPMDLGNFLNYKKLVQAREEEGKGISLSFSVSHNHTLEKYIPSKKKKTHKFYVGYEKDGNFSEEMVELGLNKAHEFPNISGFSYVRMDREEFETFHALIKMKIRNHLTKKMLNTRFKNINKLPQKVFSFGRKHFANLYPPKSEFFFLGWISYESFKERMASLPCYGPPKDKIDKYSNTEGVPSRPGLLYPRTTCFIYPNVWRGGMRNKNFYVLPRDLRTMDELLKIV